jgi:hypothetical protein
MDELPLPLVTRVSVPQDAVDVAILAWTERLERAHGDQLDGKCCLVAQQRRDDELQIAVSVNAAAVPRYVLQLCVALTQSAVKH